MSFYGHQNERRIDLTAPWYKNEGCISPLIFFALLAVGMVILMLIPS